MFLVFWFLWFLCKFAFLRTRGGNKEWFFHRFFCIHPHYVTMTKIESRDFALIFSGKRPFNTLSLINLSDIVIVAMNFHQYLAWQMLDSKKLCHMQMIAKAIVGIADSEWMNRDLLYKEEKKINSNVQKDNVDRHTPISVPRDMNR